MSSRRSGTAGRTWCALWVAVLLLLGGEEAARATTCLGRPLWASPPPATVLPLNPRILISFYPSSKVDSYRPYLAGPGHSVNLEKMGEHPLGRAGAHVFAPAKLLRPRTRYELRFRRLPKDLHFEPVAWTTGDAEDSTPPSWTEAPSIDESRSRVDSGFGEGSGSWRTSLTLPSAERLSVPWVMVEVESGAQSPTVFAGAHHRLFFLDGAAEWSGIELADPPCDDHLGLEAGTSYTLAIQLFDLAGNASVQERVRFRIPIRPGPDFAVHTSINIENVRRKVEPEYRDLARKARVRGVVEGYVLVDAAGEVVSVRIEKALPMGLDQSAWEALAQWKFPPSPEPERQIPFQTHFLMVPPVFVPSWSAD